MTNRIDLDALLADIDALGNEDVPAATVAATPVVAAPVPVPSTPVLQDGAVVPFNDSRLRRIVRLVLENDRNDRYLKVAGCVGTLEDGTAVLIELPKERFSKARLHADLVRMCKTERVFGKRLGLFDRDVIVKPAADAAPPVAAAPVVAPTVPACRCGSVVDVVDGLCLDCALNVEPPATEEVVPIPAPAPARREVTEPAAPVAFSPNPDYDVDEFINAQLGTGPVDDFCVDRFPRCPECGLSWHTPTEDCAGDTTFEDIEDTALDAYTVEFVFEVEPECAASPRAAALLARRLFQTGAVTALVTDLDGNQTEINLR